MESNSTDTTTAIVQATDIGQLTLNDVRIVKLSGSSTASGLSLSQTASNLLYGITSINLRVAGGSGGNSITNNQLAAYTIPQTTNAIPFYAYQSTDGLEVSQLGGLVIASDGSINLKSTQGNPGSGTASQEKCYYDTTAQARKCSYNNGTFFNVPQVIGGGTAAMTTAAIGSLACGTTVTVSATGVATTDTITQAFNAGPAANPGELVVSAWPTTNNVNFQCCNPTAGSVTPSAATLNWRVLR